jgi:hypothetical protein
LCRYLCPCPLQCPSIWNKTGTNRLTRTTPKTEVDDVGEDLVDLHDALIHRRHREKTTSRRGCLATGEPEGGTNRKTEPTLNAGI